jgi:NitT/TauT family transport system substrate-binding protein
MRRALATLTAFGVLAALAVGLPLRAQQAPQKVKVRFSFLVAGHHAPYYLGLDRGHFASEGLAVEFGEGRGSAATVRLIGAGQEDLGYADLAVMARSIPEDVPVKAVYGVVQRNPIALCFRTSSGIKQPSDLKGKSFGMVAGGAQAVLVPAFLAIAGLSSQDVRQITTRDANADFLAGTIDVSQSFVIDKPLTYSAQKLGFATECFRYTDYGLDVLNHGFFASKETIARRGDVLRAFFRAVERSWEDAAKTPDAAVQALLKRFPDRDPALTGLELRNTFTVMQTPNSKGRPIGWMAEADWQKTIDTLTRYGGLTKTLPLEEYYTNDFVPAR